MIEAAARREQFQRHMRNQGYMPGTVSEYTRYIGLLSEHAGNDLFRINDIAVLRPVVMRYTSGGEDHAFGDQDNGGPRAAIKQYLAFLEADSFECFVSDDVAYRAWLGTHPNGVVVNCKEPPDPAYLVLHAASCGSIADKVGTAYMKICANNTTGIYVWLAEQGFEAITNRHYCVGTATPIPIQIESDTMTPSHNEDTPLNQILYGPPGTGKTYHTVNETLKILDPDFARANEDSAKRGLLQQRFDELKQDGRVKFVTFHQSFSYEDFVEGLRACPRSDGTLEYVPVDGVFKELCKSVNASSDSPILPKVLIIDEINRGNISRIFGELITLLEPSKRAGADEALSAVLPYSRTVFSVPANLYIIGTMNTADRSLASLDVALRRRFDFKEMPPRSDLLDDIVVDGINIGILLWTMNRRIEVLLSPEHCLGHAYFMPLRDEPTLRKLSSIFERQIIPLLKEFFFEDWERIRWVLNDHRKEDADRFIVAPPGSVAALFGDDLDGKIVERSWCLNEQALTRLNAFRGIVDPQASVVVRASPIVARPPGDIEHEASFEEWQIRQHTSQTIEVIKDGVNVSPVYPILLGVAEKIGVSPKNGKGNDYNTRQLGRAVILALKAAV